MSAIADKKEISEKDKITWEITSEHVSNLSGIKHVYMRQTYNDLEIIGTESSFHFDNSNRLLQSHNAFSTSSNLNENRAFAARQELSCDFLIKEIAYGLGIKNRKLPAGIISHNYSKKEILMDGGELSRSDILFRGVYFYNDSKELELGYLVEIEDKYSHNYWEVLVGAHSGAVIRRTNYTKECAIHPLTNHNREERIEKHRKTAESAPGDPNTNNCYLVYPYPLENPYGNPQESVSNPANSTASPYGWHDDNGVAGHEYTITRGNNVHAKEDFQDDDDPNIGFSPDGGSNLNFNFPIDLTKEPDEYLAGAVTNLFYWNNLIHDVMHFYGFDEAAGNFQEMNYTGQGIGGDHVHADAQDNGNCNATFATPTDGGNPRMQMYTCSNSTPSHDSGLDNGVVVHEYGHGISIRLTGGAGTSSCLNNREQMGEGWSDFYGMMFTMQPGDMGSDKRGMGNYLVGQPENGNGIRPYAYSTDLGLNPQTYNHINSVSIPHGVGSVWCTMLWEMNWALVDHHGFDPDIYNGTGGNNIALALVTEGLKLQKCNPGFIDGRDAILKADTALYQGANSCLIWGAFAKRGLGYSADQGSSFSVSDGIEAFDLPPCTPSNCFDASQFYAIADQQLVQGCDTFSYNVCIGSSSGYTGNVMLSSMSMLDTAIIEYSNTNPTVPDYITIDIIDTLGLSENDTFHVSILVTSDLDIDTVQLQLLKYSEPDVIVLTGPGDNLNTLESSILFEWEEDANAELLNFQLSLDQNFTTTLLDTNLIKNKIVLDIASYASAPIFWRVKAVNDCYTGDYSPIRQLENTACGATFRDPGGTSNYPALDDKTYVLCSSSPGESVVTDFTIFDLEAHASCGWDYLDIYQGNTTDINKRIGRYCGSGLDVLPNNGHIFSIDPSGCLTFVFHSDPFIAGQGWEAAITCSECPNIAALDIDITGITCTNSTDGKIKISNADNFDYDLLLVKGTDTLTEQNNSFENLATGDYILIAINSTFPACDTIINMVTVPIFNQNTILTESESLCALDSNAYIHLSFSCAGDAPNFSSYLLPGNLTEADHHYDSLPPGEYQVNVLHTGLNIVIMDTTIIIDPIDIPIAEQITIDTISETDAANYTGLITSCIGPEVIHSNNNRVAINDYQTSTSSIVINEDTRGENFVLEFEITHTYVGDLLITLENPNGVTYTLFDDLNCSQDNLHITTSDTSSLFYSAFQNQCMTSSTGSGNQGPPYAKQGSFQAKINFNQIDFSTLMGSWKLKVEDEVGGDEGYIEYFKMSYTETPTPQWYSDELAQNLVYEGDTLKPYSLGLLTDPLPLYTSGLVTYYVKCDVGDCSSELEAFSIFIEEGWYDKIADCQIDTVALDQTSMSFLPSDKTISANKLLETEGLIPANYISRYTAGEALHFKPGFEIELGALLEAVIENCEKQD